MDFSSLWLVEMTEVDKFMKKIIIIAVVIIVIAAAGYAYFSAMNSNVLSPEEAKAKAEEFINNNLMQAGQKATVKEITLDNDLYKLVIDIGNGQDIDSYLTKDGTKFFPQVLDIEETEQKNNEDSDSPTANQTPAATVSTQNDKPTVEIFVMSHCPYGTQIEKGILPVLATLGDKIDFSLKFCDYAMHGQKELNEQLAQHCIQKEQNDKFISYLTCFLEAGESDSCLTKAGVNVSQMNSCVASTDEQYKVTELFNDESSWRGGRYPQFNVDKDDASKYGITGSPGLVINGEKISSSRDSASLLKTICSAFDEQPEECSEELSATTPSAGFGVGGSGSDSGAGCGE